MRIRFLRDVVVQDGSGRAFKKDEVYDLAEASCRHWIVRNVAQYEQEEERGKGRKEDAKIREPKESFPEDPLSHSTGLFENDEPAKKSRKEKDRPA